MTASPATSLHLQGMTELTLLAPLKRGFVPSGDACTYVSRLRLLFATLMAARSKAREQEQGSAFSDVVARVQTIHSFRLAVLEPTNQLLLAVTFDSGWEPYIRKVWRDLGPLLDVIFCHCEGYPLAADSAFETYVDWIRRQQVQAGFFYIASGLSVGDLRYLVDVERLQRDGDAGAAGCPAHQVSEQAIARLRIPHPSETALQQARLAPALVLARGLEALAGLYALTDFFAETPDPDARDAAVLLRAAQDLLVELREPLLRRQLALEPGLQAQFRTELAWFFQPPPASRRPRRPPPPVPAPQDLQSGLLQPDPDTSHGLLVLLQIRSRTAFRQWLAAQLPALAPQADARHRPLLNLAFTPRGLRRLGVPAETLARLPREFVEGMEARADLLGDLRSNHPVHWQRPRRHGLSAQEAAAAGPGSRIDLAEVDLVLQWRVLAPAAAQDDELGPKHPLFAAFQTLASEPGLSVLAVEPLRRQTLGRPRAGTVPGGAPVVEHFGFVDGLSQPRFVGTAGDAAGEGLGARPRSRDELPLGELLLGHPSERGDGDPALADDPLLADGSFLVIRKLRQFPERLQQRLAAESARLSREGIRLSVDELKGALMGRMPDGRPLVTPDGPGPNDFDYRGDPQGLQCPFQAHARRANPREGQPNAHVPGGREPVPRLLRRGMSYGPDVTPDELAGRTPARERGLFFMACNASIAEQFEVVQRWLAGGNATGVGSAQGDPLLGVPVLGERRTLRFLREDAKGQQQLVRVFLDEEPDPRRAPAAPQPFVQLAWGLYAFLPSLRALAALTKGPATEAAVPASDPAREGQALIEQLQGPLKGAGAAAWKQCLEDMVARKQGVPDKLWAAVRELHGGVLDTGTDYGVLVGDPALLQEVLLDPQGHYSVCGYQARMQNSIGPIFLGMDAGAAYARLADPVNAIIGTLGRDEAYRLSRAAMSEVLRQWWAEGTASALPGPSQRVPLDLKRLSDEVLARLSRHWFGLPDGGCVQAASRDWHWQADVQAPPRCPGHFDTPSRYFFQPMPEGTAAEEQGQRHGRQLLAAVSAWVAQTRAGAAAPAGTLTPALFAALPGLTDAELASTCIGVLMGFLPTVDGCWRRALMDSRADPRLWLARARLLAGAGTPDLAQAERALRPWLDQALLRHPVPDMIWRTARTAHGLGGGSGAAVPVAAGRRVVLGLMSGTQVQWQAREAGGEAAQAQPADLSLVFGGQRPAGAPHPLHACPGYEAAMGMLLGMSAGLLQAELQTGTQAQLMWMVAPPPA